MNDRLLNPFLAGAIEEATINAKLAILRDELAVIEASLGKMFTVDATNVRAAPVILEFSQKKPEIRRSSTMLEKRRILEVVRLNRVLGHVTLEPQKRKPLDELAKRPSIQSSRGDKTPLERFIAGVRGWEAGLRRRLKCENTIPE